VYRTIIPRKRGDGTTVYRAQIVKKENGKVVWREGDTFERRAAAQAWLDLRETELRKPGALQRVDDPPLREVIDRYINESEKQIGRTKAQVLRTLKTLAIADLRCSKVTSTDCLAMLQALDVEPSTRQNYLSHLGAVFSIARPAWGYPLDPQTIKDTFIVGKKLGVTGKGRSRDRRPAIAELDLLIEHFIGAEARRHGLTPMSKIVPFALFSTRRQEEITRIEWPDYQGDRVLVRDMKNPGEKIGNDTWVDLPPEAQAYIEAMPRVAKQIFPYTTDAIGAAFTRACYVLGINTEDMPDAERLHFHNLRHEGVSRLFEMGRTIPQAASVSGHRDWKSLKRYTHLRHTGDKYAGWKWANPQ
jgi:integrase